MQQPQTSSSSLTDFSACIDACAEALKACQACAFADIQSGDALMDACALLNLDCADICTTTLNALARRSPHYGDFCAVCAHLCRACAAECARHPHHAHCLHCAQACERCAVACERHAGARHQ
jgi:hypothetical protein